MKKLIAVLEGDGIGPEIMREGIKVMEVIARRFGHEFIYEKAPFGAGAYFETGSPFPDQTKALCDRADAILKGPVGLAVEDMKKIPQDKRPEIGAILPLRKRYDTYANYRPVRLPRELCHFSPLKPEILKDGIDIMMIRELVGGIYFGKKVEGSETDNRYAKDDCTYTYEEVARVAETAFEEARKRKSPLINIHKSNVLATSRFWNDVVESLCPKYADIPYKSVLVDNAAFQLMVNPAQFNGVMLLENMQGDILSDQAGGVLGSLGLMPSACLGPKKVYVEPAHGSAPDIAGQNKANPYSMIGSVALLLDLAFGLKTEAELIWNALFRLFKEGFSTVELARMSPQKAVILSTSDFGDKVAEYLKG